MSRPSRRVRVSPRRPPERLDRALVEALAAAGDPVTRSALARAFEAGCVRIEGVAARPSRKVDAPMEVEVELVEPEPMRAEPEDLPLSILYEDEHMLVVDKAAGMVVHASAGHERGTLVNAVLHHLRVAAKDLPVLAGNDATRPGIVHRLDRDTSGVLVVAKHARAQEGLAAMFRTHALQREYFGVLLGELSWSERRVETGHARDPADRRRFAPKEDSKRRAISELRVVERLHGATACAIVLHTGRTHQIRMHARFLGHPILGDALYGFGKAPRDERVQAAVDALGRHALHARVLAISHPITQTPMRFEAPLPADLVALVAALR